MTLKDVIIISKGADLQYLRVITFKKKCHSFKSPVSKFSKLLHSDPNETRPDP